MLKPKNISKFLQNADLITVDYLYDYNIYEKDGKYYRVRIDEFNQMLSNTFVEVIPVPVLTYVYMSEKEIEEAEKKKKIH